MQLLKEESHYVATYRKCLAELQRTHGPEAAQELIVGGQFERVGRLERDLLLTLGLRPDHIILDVGCGTGRLACQLAGSHRGRYVGTDILPELLAEAERRSARPDWSFVPAEGPPLPAESESIDWVTFFSVFTHIADEDIFRYLEDAKRVLRPEGRIVFSYLEFEDPNHWARFEHFVQDRAPAKVHTQFMARCEIEVWASRLGLKLEHAIRGGHPWIVPHLDAGPDATAPQSFGQAIAVLRRV